jgi:hypothetical protein
MSQRDVPVLADQSWAELWGGLLSADFRNGDDSVHLNGGEVSSTSFYNVEEGIESWVAQSLLTPSNDQSSHPQPIPIEASPTCFSLNNPKLLCYGMVSHPNTLSLTECDSLWSEATAEHSLYIDLPGRSQSRGEYVGS